MGTLPQDSGFAREAEHPIFEALKRRDLQRAFEVSRERDDWGEIVVATGPLRGQSVLHLVAGQKPKRGHEPEWYDEWCHVLCREVCFVPQEYGYLWVGRGRVVWEARAYQIHWFFSCSVDPGRVVAFGTPR